ncbi:FtsQ-type POTRA domain-containing protein [Kordiimonas sp. SCSIO 12603]|uniref:cell division protein FtsQ/DivIB n=1 Tax=Kordiimonas sp. SCSIO 12603 TaxID=2829596 RepID=UPI002106CCE3|nr:FtsQ-type POTRA domain-containing protein [Kordiimonas sp. SCSIO 12603]UTW58016.1 FtsQ-type POTRA domain-containing protein [Kordiimonas sp. SCSIO 12603]
MTAFVKQHRYGLSLFTFILLVASVMLFARSVTESWFYETTRQAGFELSQLSVSGAERTAYNDVLAVLDIDDGVPILSVDLVMIKERIETLPWVKQAKVSRIFPGEIKVSITEREAFALWQQEGVVRLIDPDGVVITARGLHEFSHLPLVVGEAAPAHIETLFSKLETAGDLSDRVKTAVFVGERRWDIIFDNGIRLKLPEEFLTDYNGDAAWDKFVRLEAAHNFLAREISVLDMRVADRVVVRVTPTGRRMMDGKEWAT